MLAKDTPGDLYISLWTTSRAGNWGDTAIIGNEWGAWKHSGNDGI